MTIIVTGFKDIPSGKMGPAEACGIIRLRDTLIAVNGDLICGLARRAFAEHSRTLNTPHNTAMAWKLIVAERFDDAKFDSRPYSYF